MQAVRRNRRSRRPFRLTPVQFARYGTLFIVFGILFIALPGIQDSKRNARNELSEQRKTGQYSLLSNSTGGWLADTLAYSDGDESHQAAVLKGRPLEHVKLLYCVLNSDCPEYKYSPVHIRMKGVVKNYLDKVESGAILE